MERTKADVQSLARGTAGHIRVGFACATYFQPLVPHIIRTFRERYPGGTLTPEQSVAPRLVTGLRGNEVDVAFVWPPLDDSTGLGLDVLIEEPLVAVLPSEHPLANDSTVELASLANDTFILLPAHGEPGIPRRGCRELPACRFYPQTRSGDARYSVGRSLGRRRIWCVDRPAIDQPDQG